MNDGPRRVRQQRVRQLAESDDSDSDLTEADPDHIRELCLAF